MSQQNAYIPDDVIIQFNGDKLLANAGPVLRQNGWVGGLWVKYVEPVNGADDYVVEATDGNVCTGFLVFPSEDYDRESWSGPTNNFTTIQLRPEQGSVAGASTVTISSGGGRYLFRVFETIALGAGGDRDGGFAVYTLNESLKVSENGYLCNDPDDRLAAAGVTTPCVVGLCCATPQERNGYRLGLDLKW